MFVHRILLLFFSILLVNQILASDEKSIISELNNEYKKIEQILKNSPTLSTTKKEQISSIKHNILKIKTTATGSRNETPVYYKNFLRIDDNLTLVDFYVYEYTDNSYQVFARLKNQSGNYLDWVRLRFNLYKNGVFQATDYTFIDYETYNSAGISPYNYTFIETFLDKTDFDEIVFQAEYDVEYQEDEVLWDQVLKLEASNITPSWGGNDWQGVVENNFNYKLKYPAIYAAILKDGKMIALEYTFLDVPNNEMPANSIGVFDSFIDLPESYDEINYFLSYSPSSLEGSGNLPPNRPIFLSTGFFGMSRTPKWFDIFVLEPNDNKMKLSLNNGKGVITDFTGNYSSGTIKHQYSFPDGGEYAIRVKASDGYVETGWSDEHIIEVATSTTPKILTTQIDTALYNTPFAFRLEATKGYTPYKWELKEGKLPDGLAFYETQGIISGTPTMSGEESFKIYCTDNGIPTKSDSVDLHMVVHNNPPRITSNDSMVFYISEQVRYEALAEDIENNSIVFSFLNYPKWLNPANNVLIGTAPNHTGIDSFLVVATDGELSDTLLINLQIKIRPFGILNPDIEFENAIYKKPYQKTLQVNGGIKPYMWSIKNGNLPSGLIINNLGILTGVPEESGFFTGIFNVQDSNNPPASDSLEFSIIVKNTSPFFTSPDSISVRKNDEFIYNIGAEDAEENMIHYNVTYLPEWLKFQKNTLTGTVPLNAADTTFQVTATDGELSDTLDVKISIMEPSNVSSAELPMEFKVSACYPNPFNSTTNFSVDIPEQLYTEISVFDINGKKVSCIYKGKILPGNHSFYWQAKDIASGIYFIKFSSNKYHKLAKCSFIK